MELYLLLSILSCVISIILFSMRFKFKNNYLYIPSCLFLLCALIIVIYHTKPTTKKTPIPTPKPIQTPKQMTITNSNTYTDSVGGHQQTLHIIENPIIMKGINVKINAFQPYSGGFVQRAATNIALLIKRGSQIIWEYNQGESYNVPIQNNLNQIPPPITYLSKDLSIELKKGDVIMLQDGYSFPQAAILQYKSSTIVIDYYESQ